MGQKTRPTGFRVGIVEDWRSRWYAPKKEFGALLVEDAKIRKFIKDEYKQAELPAEVRGAIRRRQMMASRARMMAAVPDADVVVTNPTHYAVALRYSPELAAPEVVAKGMDLVAFKIREIAKDAGVPVIPDPPLARALHASVEVGDHIPEELYEAVAQVLAFVYRTANQRAAA